MSQQYITILRNILLRGQGCTVSFQRLRHAVFCCLSAHKSQWQSKGEAALTVISPYYSYLLLFLFPLLPLPAVLPSAGAAIHPAMATSTDDTHHWSRVGLCAGASRRDVVATDALLGASISLRRCLPTNIYFILH